LDEFESADVLGQGQQLSQVIQAGLLKLKSTGLIQYVRGEGCVWGIECQGAGGFTAEQVAVSVVEACYRGTDQGDAIHLLGPLS
jgi:4-aminobutyrate aminotransferase-like enzyme